MCSRFFGSLVALFLCCFGVGCEEEPSTDAERSQSSFERGDHVVVESSAARFYEGRVLSVGSEQLRLQVGGEPVTVAASDAYKVPDGDVDVRVGNFAICRIDAKRASWVPCKVLARAERAYDVETTSKARLSVPSGSLIVPTELTRLNITHRFEDSARRTAFARRAREGVGPRGPPEWRPQANERVVVRHDAAWFTARTSRVEDGGVMVTLPGASTVDAFDATRVVPMPPYEHTFSPGDFALEPPPTESDPWTLVRVVQIIGDDLDVEDDQGRRKRVHARDVVPLAP